MAGLYEELKKRNVIRVTAAYAVVAWLTAQLADFAISTFGAPVWVLRTFVVLLALGLPLAVILAWAFDLTPEGVKRASDDASPAPARRGSNAIIMILLGIVLVAAVVLQFWRPEIPPRSASSVVKTTGDSPSRHFDIAFPDDTPLAFVGPALLGNGRTAFAISPDGTELVFVGERDGEYALYVRRLDAHEVRKLPGTEDGYNPFFSPNGHWLAFFAGKELKRTRLDGGVPVTVAEATNSTGGTWLDNDSIVALTQEGDRMLQVSSQGDPVESANWINRGAPRALPGGQRVLMSWPGLPIRVGDLATSQVTQLPVSGSDSRFVAGFIFYSQGSTLHAGRFDPASLEMTSAPVPVLTDLRNEVYGFSQWAISADGTFVYAPGIAADANPLQWVRGDASETLDLSRSRKGTFEIAPDGKQLALIETQAGATDLWLYDFDGRPPRKLTVDGNVANNTLLWMPDGNSIVYHREEMGIRTPYRLDVRSGLHGVTMLGSQGRQASISSVSRDGRFISINRFPDPAARNAGSEDESAGLFVFDLEDGEEIRIPTRNPNDWGPVIAPNGRSVVYTSPESGEYQLYLQPLPPTGERYQVSRAGGSEESRWSRDGSKVYYRSGRRIMVVAVQTTPEVSIGEPEIFYEGSFVNVGGRSYDIGPNGERALVIRASEDTTRSLRVVTNWFGEVERILSASESE